MVEGRVSELYIYPVKSCSAVPLRSAKCSPAGFDRDRQWLIFSPDGKMLTQRDYPRMALIKPIISPSGELILTAPNMPPLVVCGTRHVVSMRVDVWGRSTAGQDQGEEAARWVSEFLSVSCRLLCAVHDGNKHQIAFADCAPLLVMSQGSLNDLNSRLEKFVPMDRFRPSIVVTGLPPYVEDAVRILRVGRVTLEAMAPCARCVLVTIDQQTGELTGPEPLSTLGEYRREGNKVMFGRYFTAKKPGAINLGDRVSFF
jgi:uncharacterized protein